MQISMQTNGKIVFHFQIIALIFKLNLQKQFRSQLQPGCTEQFKNCGHIKAVTYYYASLFPQFKFIGGDCKYPDPMFSSKKSLFGEFNDGKYGEFCFQTTPCFPFTQTIDTSKWKI